MSNKIEEITGKRNYHNQYRIICKCTSMADANRKCAAVGLGNKVFSSAYTSKTGNEIELQLCEMEDIWIECGIYPIKENYVPISKLI